jgi:predicted transporter
MEKLLLISIVLSLLLIIGVYIDEKYFTEEEDRVDRRHFLILCLGACIPMLNIYIIFSLLYNSERIKNWLNKPL